MTEYLPKTSEIIEIHHVVIENHPNPDISKQFFSYKKLFACTSCGYSFQGTSR